MWIIFAFGSALFAGLTSILAKCGIKNTDSNVATALRTIVVLIFSWIMVFVSNTQIDFSLITTKTIVFLILSGIATGASWLCYFKALQLGDVNKVTPIDKSSTILTMIMAFIFLGEKITFIKGIAMIFISVGTYLMITKKEDISVETKNFKLEDIGYETIPKDMYFVLGDNRTNSSDSREFGLVKKDEIIGKIVMRVYPFSKIKFY